MKHIRLSLLLGLIAVSMQGQLLTKKEAIKLALANNFDIQIANNSADIAENNAGILNSGYLPSLRGDAGANYQKASTTTSFPGTVDGDGIPRPDNVIEGAETQRYNAGLTLNYTLFDGLGRYYTYKSLKERYNLSKLQARETIENTVLQLFSVYYEVARLTENIKILEEALQISQDRVTRANYQFDYGQNTKLDVLNAQVDVANDSINVLNAKQQLITTKRDLNLVINRELNQEFVVDTLVQFVPKITLEDYVKEAPANNVSLLQNEQNIQLSAYDIKINKSGYLPTVGLNGSYGWNQARNPAGVFFPGNISNATALGAGVSLTWNIFDGGSTAVRVKNAKLAYENQELLKDRVVAEVKRDIANAFSNYENRISIFAIQEQNVLTNENNFERSKERFKLGQITSIEFRQAQINLTNAKANRTLAKYDAKLAELQLLQLTGQLLNWRF